MLKGKKISWENCPHHLHGFHRWGYSATHGREAPALWVLTIMTPTSTLALSLEYSRNIVMLGWVWTQEVIKIHLDPFIRIDSCTTMWFLTPQLSSDTALYKQSLKIDPEFFERDFPPSFCFCFLLIASISKFFSSPNVMKTFRKKTLKSNLLLCNRNLLLQ